MRTRKLFSAGRMIIGWIAIGLVTFSAFHAVAGDGVVSHAQAIPLNCVQQADHTSCSSRLGTASQVREPATLLLLGSVLAGLGAWTRRRLPDRVSERTPALDRFLRGGRSQNEASVR